FIDTISSLIKGKKSGRQIDRYEFSSSESFFDFVLFDTFERDSLYVEIWISVGLLSDGKIFGFDEGVRFVVTVENLDAFVVNLENQYKSILKSI
ncbi:MAG: hypothetical protein ABF449_12325, partial [Ethanoligenens sp.]